MKKLRPLDMQAEEYSATGNLASEGMRNQLGRPKLDRLALLVREAAQNAWDAKSKKSAFVTFGLHAWTLSKEQLGVLDKVVFKEKPPGSAYEAADSAALGQTLRESSKALDDARVHGGLRVLAVTDRGTTGLGGPTRADEIGKDDEPRDFVDFFRNMGTPPDKEAGGGTFGYGKAALYLSSQIHTILVHTHSTSNGKPVSRLMGSSLTNNYRKGKKLCTGRHWWGRTDSKSGIVEPVEGDEADAIAAALGMPGFKRTQTGTTILIIEPDFGVWKTAQGAVDYMLHQVLLSFWPKMVPWPGEKHPRMKFEASVEGKSHLVPSPEKTHPFDAFVDALHKVRAVDSGGEADQVWPLMCHRPKKALGYLGLAHAVRRKSPLSRFAEDGTVSNIHERSHHVALLRRPEMVVEYREYPAIPQDNIVYAGVFLANEDMDRVYAGAEPPAHDEWSADILNEKNYRTFVRVTFRRLNEQVREFLQPHSLENAAVEGSPLGKFADHLGEVLYGIPGPGARLIGESEAPLQTGSSASRGPRPSVRVLPGSSIKVDGRRRLRQFEVDLRHAKKSSSTRLTASVATVLVGGSVEKDAPEGAAVPEVVSWSSPSGDVVQGETSIITKGRVHEGTWIVTVSVPSDAMVSLSVRGEKR